MKRSTVKETFGGEVAFTKFISEDKDTSDRLLAAIDMDLGEYSVEAEARTLDGKRADLVVSEGGSVQAVIEAQDASGLLDSVHTSKITYYMYEKECNTGVLICEDADEHLKGYLKHLNENTPFNIYLVYARVYDNKFIDFVTTMRPFSFLEKKIKRVIPAIATGSSLSTSNSNEWLAEFVSEKRAENPELFGASVSLTYLANSKLGKQNFAVAIHPKKGGQHTVELWHSKKMQGNETFDATMDVIVAKQGDYASWNIRNARRVKANTWEEALAMLVALSDAVESGEIHG